MVLNEPRANYIHSSEGWIVQIIPQRAGNIKYFKEDKYIKVDSEMLVHSETNPYNLAIYTDSIKFWTDERGQKTPVSPEEKQEIIHNISLALEYKKIKPDFVGDL
ncbi:MAG: hypothetical protein K0R98_1615 [Rickettsiaceae bacterium]|jgi:hypothetical protein|nr:hypothetical protein [Gammaproteobacteria bacterium]MCE3233358.1 hypothetical protein [Rickettsiaceae bacterium]